MTGYQIRYSHSVWERDALKLDEQIKARIRKAIESKLTVFPERHSKPLKHSLKGLWSLRVGDWRVLFKISGEQVIIVGIGHRKDVYHQRTGRSDQENI